MLSGAFIGIHMASEKSDGDKSTLLGKCILQFEVNLNDIIAHKSLGMDVPEQAEIDKPDSLSAQHSAISMVICRAGTANEELPF